MTVHSWQLEPALAFVLGRTSRILLADHVGLGKTVQAGLCIAELMSRGLAVRVLVIVPASLRHQWAGELRTRFGLDAAICDADWLAERTRSLPATVNPWLEAGVFIVSMDFVKRLEVLHGLEDGVWDLLAVDEAHQAGTETERARATGAIARRARRVLLITATPHDGDASRFRALCSFGAFDKRDEILSFRRSRRSVGLDNQRRVHLLPIAPGPEDCHLDALFRRYADAVQRERGRSNENARLAMVVLKKRRLSSAAAFAVTAERRRQLLERGAAATPTQSTLPFLCTAGESDEEDDVLAPVLSAPGLNRLTHERAWLAALILAARRTASTDRKLAALSRFLSRTNEPVVVFSEYRDTIEHWRRVLTRRWSVALLHGALPDAVRAASLASFLDGSARVLLTTDVAGVGLNLHQVSRVVINAELPWNPTRLEQRAGRVDRMGQRLVPHVLHLVWRESDEAEVLGRLHTRVAVMRSTIGDAGAHLDAWTMASGTAAEGNDHPRSGHEDHLGRTGFEPGDLSEVARRAAASAVRARELVRRQALTGHGRPRRSRIPLTLAPPGVARRLRSLTGPGLLLLFDYGLTGRSGQRAELGTIAIHLPLDGVVLPCWQESDWRRRLAPLLDAASRRAQEEAEHRADDLAPQFEAAEAAIELRERSIVIDCRRSLGASAPSARPVRSCRRARVEGRRTLDQFFLFGQRQTRAAASRRPPAASAGRAGWEQPVRGRLVSSGFLATELFRLFAGRLGETGVDWARARFRRIMSRHAGRFGPACGARTIAECVAEPLFGLFGYAIHDCQFDRASGWLVGTLEARGRPVGAGLIAPWGDASSHGWSVAVRRGVEAGVRWALAINGRTISLLDIGRVFARLHVEFDLDEALRRPPVFDVLWALARAEALVPVRGRADSDGTSSLLDAVISGNADHTRLVCGALQHGVRRALARFPAPDRSSALTLVFRVLFLLYAESRALVPLWHPVYRESYSLDAMSAALARGEPPTGFWETLVAISDLAHRGCRWDALHVVPFNGRLFAPGVLLRGPRRQRDTTVRDVLLDLHDPAADRTCRCAHPLSRSRCRAARFRLRASSRRRAVRRSGSWTSGRWR